MKTLLDLLVGLSPLILLFSLPTFAAAVCTLVLMTGLAAWRLNEARPENA